MSTSSWMRPAAIALTATALCACGTVPLPPPGEDAPLFRRIDARIGTSYAAAARLAFVTSPVMRIDLGQASVVLFQKAFHAMFSDTTVLPDWPPWRYEPPAVDGVIELERVDAQLHFGDDRGTPDVISVAYRVCLYEPDATAITCWNVDAGKSHQRGLGDCLDLRPCIALQVEVAVREAVARFLIEAEKDPALREWAARLRSQEALP